MRSLLFLPGNNPDMLINGDLLGSDGIIIDLEDAVAPEEKDAARVLARNAIRFFRYRTPVIVRINGLDTGEWRQDLVELVPEQPAYIMLPKTGCAADVETLCAALEEQEGRQGASEQRIGIIALVETAMGVMNAYEIARAGGGLHGLALGAEDLTADLRCGRTRGGEEIRFGRSQLVSAARAAGVECYDTPFTDAGDLVGLESDAAVAKGLGFSGKLVIHPRHIEAVNRIFSPSRAEVEYAGEVLAALEEGRAAGKGAVALRGKMIDRPVEERARQVLELAGRLEVHT